TVTSPEGFEFKVEEDFIVNVYPAKTMPPPPYELMSEEEVKRAEWLKPAIVTEPLAKGSTPVGGLKLEAEIPDATTAFLFSQEVRSRCIRFREPYTLKTPEGERRYSPGDVECNLPWEQAKKLCEVKFKVLRSPPLMPLIDPKGRVLREPLTGEAYEREKAKLDELLKARKIGKETYEKKLDELRGEYTYSDPEDLEWARLEAARGNLQQVTTPIAEWLYPEYRAKVRYKVDVYTKFLEEAKRMRRAGKIKEAILYLVCYDDKTEVLTAEGFKKFDEVDLDDEIATLNPETGYIEYLKPVAVWKIPYKGKMVHIHSRNIDLMVTPEHLLYCKDRFKPKSAFEFIPAEQVYRKYCRQRYVFLRGGAKWKGEDMEYFPLPRTRRFTVSQAEKLYETAIAMRRNGASLKQINETLNVYSNDWICRGHRPRYWDLADTVPIENWLRFFGWWLAEGYVCKVKRNHIIGIAQRRPRWKSEIAETIRSLGVQKVFIGRKQISFSNKQLYQYLRQFGKAKDKFIPKEIKNLPPERLRILFDAMMKGDGSFNKYGWRTYATSSKRLADDVQEILLKMGYSAIIIERKHVGFSKGPIYEVSISRKMLAPALCKKPKLVDYEGYVYDVTMPRNHIILVRRNGKVCWSSNCHSLGIPLDCLVQILGVGYWTAWRAVAELARPTEAEIKRLMPLLDETATLERWTTGEKEEIVIQLKAPKEPKIGIGYWLGRITLYPLRVKPEEELMRELKRILTLEGYPALTPEEEAELRKQLREYWRRKAIERLRLAYFLR
ncbi:MAG: LAGLIDADG family homing endonuclease, partial [Candidatus Parvarchaeota archaeon]